jgi:iron-sulfur cluster assembly protein
MSSIAILEPTIETSTYPVTLTQSAVAQVRRLIAKKGDYTLKLRVGVKGGGCSGLSYILGLEEAPRPNDTVYEVDGLTVMVDPKSAQFISGMTLDYSTANLLEGGWKYLNPNVQKSCGCGTSFTPK